MLRHALALAALLFVTGTASQGGVTFRFVTPDGSDASISGRVHIVDPVTGSLRAYATLEGEGVLHADASAFDGFSSVRVYLPRPDEGVFAVEFGPTIEGVDELLASGMLPANTGVIVPVRGGEEGAAYTLTLRDSIEVRGRAVDPSGSPVPVSPRAYNGYPATRNAPDGTFSIHVLADSKEALFLTPDLAEWTRIELPDDPGACATRGVLDLGDVTVGAPAAGDAPNEIGITITGLDLPAAGTTNQVVLALVPVDDAPHHLGAPSPWIDQARQRQSECRVSMSAPDGVYSIVLQPPVPTNTRGGVHTQSEQHLRFADALRRYAKRSPHPRDLALAYEALPTVTIGSGAPREATFDLVDVRERLDAFMEAVEAHEK